MPEDNDSKPQLPIIPSTVPTDAPLPVVPEVKKPAIVLPKIPAKPNLNQLRNDPKNKQKGFNTNLKSTIRRAGPRGR